MSKFDPIPAPQPDLEWLSAVAAVFLVGQFLTAILTVTSARDKWWLAAFVHGCLLLISTLAVVTTL